MERGMMLSTNTNRDSRGRVQAQANLSGLLGDDNAISYGLSANHNTGGMNGSSTSASANATYRASQTELSGSVSASSGYQQFSVGARGAIVAHPGGVTLSQSVSDTFAIVEAKNAEGARINNAPGVKVDSRGYAVVPYLTPFSMNEVSIDPKGLSTDVELKETSQHVAPLAGAVPLLVFKTAYGRSAVIRARQAGNMPVPFGASVLDMDGKELGVIGQAGKLLARGLSDQGELQVQWKTDTGMVGCNLSYTLPERKRSTTHQPPQRPGTALRGQQQAAACGHRRGICQAGQDRGNLNRNHQCQDSRGRRPGLQRGVGRGSGRHDPGTHGSNGTGHGSRQRAGSHCGCSAARSCHTAERQPAGTEAGAQPGRPAHERQDQRLAHHCTSHRQRGQNSRSGRARRRHRQAQAAAANLAG